MKGQHRVTRSAMIELMIYLSDLARAAGLSLGNLRTRSRKTINCVCFGRRQPTFVATRLSISGHNWKFSIPILNSQF
jgi:hypothetical protein